MASPEATSFVNTYNTDLDTENKKILQMENVVHSYSDNEDVMITSALGLLAGMKMKGAIPFKNFSTTFSTTQHLKGFYNTKVGDIYGASAFTIRGNHSHVAARVANYHYRCMNPASGITKEMMLEEEVYLEHSNIDSSIYHQAFQCPSPLTDQEVICNIVWKRLSEKSIVVTYHPLTSHRMVEDKDGKSVIRGFFHASFTSLS
ncbi:hypothetical protein TL16_g00704 [Triparma laevis f. inornata]|uniref:Uncharacterized protein n=1 Tax=Triparma laevis f. inornata TaxID=1714386 RepID=A0A9W6ZD32_9STRA|nr:hypothetical protein TL16_g00704 [Triparma laevis f. inornata]